MSQDETVNEMANWEEAEILEDIDEIRQELQKWQRRQATANLWIYQVSFALLEIRLEKPYKAGNLHLICRG